VERQQLIQREFSNVAINIPPEAIPIDLLRVVAANAAPPLAYLASRILALRTAAPADWLLVSMKAHANDRPDVVRGAALRARELATASADRDTKTRIESWLSALGNTDSESTWLRCSVCHRQSSPLITPDPSTETKICHACAERIANFALHGCADLRRSIWQLPDDRPLPSGEVPLMGRDVAAEWFVEKGHLRDGLAIAAQAILLDDAALTVRALRIMLGPKLAQPNALPKLVEALRRSQP